MGVTAGGTPPPIPHPTPPHPRYPRPSAVSVFYEVPRKPIFYNRRVHTPPARGDPSGGGFSQYTSGGPIPFCSPLPGPRSRSTEPALLKICSTQPVVRPVRTQRSRKKSASHREKVPEGRLVTLLKPHQDECEAMWGWGSTM